MPVGYLAHVVTLGLIAAAALAPPRRPRLLARAAYLATVVLNEVPQLAVALLLISTGTGLAFGDLGVSDPASLVLMAGAVGTSAAFLVLVRRASRAPAAVDQALRDAEVEQLPTHRRWWRIALTPLPRQPRTLRRQRNLCYGDHRRNRLDVLYRRDRPAGAPVLVYLHGGGYFSGSKNWEARALLHHYAARGWVCVSATYRLRPRAGFEDHLADARAVLAWARAHAADFGGDSGTLVMAGSSAGAHLTTLCALSAAPDEQLAAGVCLYGYYGRYYGRSANEPVASTPFALDARHAPPILLAHGSNDNYTTAQSARAFAAKLRAESSAPVVHVELPGGQHGFDLVRSWRLSAVIAGLDSFFADDRVRVGRADRGLLVPGHPVGVGGGLRADAGTARP